MPRRVLHHYHQVDHQCGDHKEATAVFVISLTVYNSHIAPSEGFDAFSKLFISPHIASSGWCPGNTIRYNIICLGVISKTKLSICCSTISKIRKGIFALVARTSHSCIISLSVHSHLSQGRSDDQRPPAFSPQSISWRRYS